MQLIHPRLFTAQVFSRGEVVDSLVILPGGGTMERAALWSAVAAKHKRGDAIVARAFGVGLPVEIGPDQRYELVRSYALELADRYRVAVEVNVHGSCQHSGRWNHYAHILVSACYANADGEMSKTAFELDPIHCKRHGLVNMVEVERERWAQLANQAREKAGGVSIAAT